MEMKFTHARVLTLGIVAAFGLAACGSSAKASVSPGAQPPASDSTSVAANAAPVVKAATVGNVGSVLVDTQQGLTLYTLTSAGKPVPCTGQCATFWPPLMLPAGTTSAVGAAGVSGLGTVSASGGMQVTANGDPLYHFSKDTGPGVAMGDGISSFGGTWHVVSAPAAGTSATTVAPAPVTTPPTTTSSYGGGY
jgi:predicted lipoprotein with Yx(FWY)xxD motif